MTFAHTQTRKILGVAAAASIVAVLAGCAQESAEEVSDRFNSMEEIPGEANSQTTIDSDGAGTIWALVRGDDLSGVQPEGCTIDGTALTAAPEDLNMPEPSDLGAPGESQTMMAFAATEVAEAGTYTLECNLDAEALLFLFEPLA
ncbi:MAG: hypothetical protein ACTHXA_12450 [Gulosibacter sp.]|uniref:hypothetical protein n=1 Tax=Gulosibacter sp. TaxID=2817531 RepID=UPI003F922177